MMDRIGTGAAGLADVMALLFHRFGPPSDLLYLRAFGNAFDPAQQVSDRQTVPVPALCI